MSMLESLVNGTPARKKKVVEKVSDSMLEGFADLMYQKENAAEEVVKMAEYILRIYFPAGQEEVESLFYKMKDSKAKFNDYAMDQGGATLFFGFKTEKEFMKAYDYIARADKE